MGTGATRSGALPASDAPAGLSTGGIQGFLQRPLPGLMILWSNSWASGECCTQDSSWIIRDTGEEQPPRSPSEKSGLGHGAPPAPCRDPAGRPPHADVPAHLWAPPSPVSRAITRGSGLDLHLQSPFPRGQAGLSSFWGADPILGSLGTHEELE